MRSPSDAAMPGALLAAMLQRVETEIRHVGGLGVAEDAEDAAFVLELVEHVRPLSLQRLVRWRLTTPARRRPPGRRQRRGRPPRSAAGSRRFTPIDPCRHVRAAPRCTRSVRSATTVATRPRATPIRQTAPPRRSSRHPDATRAIDTSAPMPPACRSSIPPAPPRTRHPNSRAPTESSGLTPARRGDPAARAHAEIEHRRHAAHEARARARGTRCRPARRDLRRAGRSRHPAR